MTRRIALLLCLLALPLSAATFTVTSTNDSGPGTLRQAILDANALGAGPHTIAFDIAPGGPQTITPETALPVVTAGQTLLDGTTQPGYAGVPVIEISGAFTGAGAHGLRIDGDLSRVQGFVINGFSDGGAGVYVTAAGVKVRNNYLGLDGDGASVIPNFHGVSCTGGCNAIEIGGPSASDRNVISGNLGAGIAVVSARPGDNSIRANYIGTDATGTLERGNFTGIEWGNSAGRIGDPDPQTANVISGNLAHGLVLTGANHGTYVIYNRIGVGPDGMTPIGNGLEGVSIDSSGNSVTENRIAHNRGHGIMVVGAGNERNLFRRNNIFSNGLRGIALGSLGGTAPNDPRDVDAGYANNLQNHPVLTSAVWDAGMLTVTGTLHSTPGTLFVIDFYSNTECDASGFGEGNTWSPSVDVTTNANGDAAIHATFPHHPGLGFITATATAIVPTRNAGETSELSQCRVVRNALASTVQFDAATLKVTEGDGFATLVVTRSGSSAGPATVDVVTSHGTASIPGDYLPPASSRLEWDDGDGAPKTVRIPIVADDFYELPEELAVELRNATGATLGGVTIATITIEDRISTTPMPADLSIYVETRATAAAQGGEINYNITATNHGPNDATGVTVTNVLPPQLLFLEMRAPAGWTCATPAAGTNGTITCTAAVLPAANGNSVYFYLNTRVAFDASGSIVNTASVSHSGSDPNPGNSSFSSTATTVDATTADLSITKTAGAARAAAGTAFTYTITVTNSGPSIASEVTVTDVLPPQLEYVSRLVTQTQGADFGCSTPEVYTNGTVSCHGFRMAPGASMTLTLHVRVAANAAFGMMTNTATVTSPAADPDDADRTAAAPAVEVVAGADLSIHKHAGTTSARPGSIFNYTISIQNSGPSAAENVVVTDVLPAGLLFEFAGPSGSFTCTTPAAGTNGTVTCTAPTLQASVVAGLQLRVRVAPDAKPGVVTNVATVTSSTSDLDTSDTTAAAQPVTIEASAGAERRLDPGTGPRAPQVSPQVATTNENALAVWREGAIPFAGGTASIRGVMFRPDAQGETLINFATPETGTDVAHPNVASAVDRYLVVWRETKASQGRILAQRLRVDGSFIDAQPLVLETGPPVVCCTDVGDPRPAVTSNGGDFYVTWATANYDVRGVVVPDEGPIAGQVTVVSREIDTKRHGHYDLEVVWTSERFAVVWLDRAFQTDPPLQEPFVLRYARVTSGGALVDIVSSESIGSLSFSAITTTATPGGGAVVTVDYDEPGPTSSSRRWCVGALLLAAGGQPDDAYSLRCDTGPPTAAPALHSTFVPVARGYLLVQPGRRYLPPFGDTAIRTSTADSDLISLSNPTTLGPLAREVAVANWRGGALLVYNRTDGDDPATRMSRVFAFLIQGHGRVRAVRH